MEDKYKVKSDETDLTEENCYELTGFKLDYFVKLTGIYGLDKDYKIEEDDFRAMLVNRQKVVISIRTKIIVELTRTIYLNRPLIENDFMIANQKGQNIGLKLLSGQVSVAIENRFNKLTTYAYREKKDNIKDEEYNGYWLWGRYGYMMDLNDDIKFKREIQEHIEGLELIDKFNLSLYQLLSNSRGSDIWYSIGWPWDGTFYLSKKSESYLILQSECKRKGFN